MADAIDLDGQSGRTSPAVGSVLAGRYHLDALLAQGGMGTVFRATDALLGQPVAIKVLLLKKWDIKAAEVAKALANLRSEAVASIRLSHPNVVRTLNYERDGAWEFLVMELLDGVDLRAFRKQFPKGRVPADDARRIGVAALHALEHAHSVGLLHLDLKPANVMLTKANLVKVCDFGLSSLTALLSRPREGTFVVGTPAYMSPEMIRQERVDARADLYSLAATLYDLVTGEPPFGRDSAKAFEGHLHAFPASHQDVPRPLMEVIVRGLEKDPGIRFQTAASMRAALETLSLRAETARGTTVTTATAGGGADEARPKAGDAKGKSMHVEMFSYDLTEERWSVPELPPLDSERTLVLAFGASKAIEKPDALQQLSRAFPRSHVVGCSSAGEIFGTEVRDDSLAVAACRFEKTQLATATVAVREATQSFAAGQTLARKLNRQGLRAVFILSEGLKVNGSELVRGFNSVLDPSVVVTGGLSGDGTRFERTWVSFGGKVESGLVVAVGLYGDHLVVTHGSKGGWDSFGPYRKITRSEGNVLFELDGRPALDLYKSYLGDKAEGLPASGLLFPLALKSRVDDEKVLVRTLLAVDEEKKSMTFAGDLPTGSVVQMMKANFDRLVAGASDAGEAAKALFPNGDQGECLAVAISCVGRRLVLGDRTEEEVEAVRDVLPNGTAVTGFYSYGEISPFGLGSCDLHNQTMTLTVFSESPMPVERHTSKRTQAPVPAPAPARPAAVPMPAVGAPVASPPPTPAAAKPVAPPPSAKNGVATTTPLVPAPAPTRRMNDEPADGPTSIGEVSPATLQQARNARSAPPPGAESMVSELRSGVGTGPSDVVNTRATSYTHAPGLTIRERKFEHVTVISLQGRLTESFEGASLSQRLHGTVVFDLARVERITSFGIREWLHMMGDIQGRLDGLYFARCSEAVASQLAMIRPFAGDGHVVSFFAPCRCPHCGHTERRLLDCEEHAVAIADGRLPELPCGSCGAPTAMDDDPRAYMAFAAEYAGRAVQPDVRAAIRETERELSADVDIDVPQKSVHGHKTIIHLPRRIDAKTRWKRALEGLEGEVEIDFSANESITSDGARTLSRSLRQMGPEVVSTVLIDFGDEQWIRLEEAGLADNVEVLSWTTTLEGNDRPGRIRILGARAPSRHVSSRPPAARPQPAQVSQPIGRQTSESPRAAPMAAPVVAPPIAGAAPMWKTPSGVMAGAVVIAALTIVVSVLTRGTRQDAPMAPAASATPASATETPSPAVPAAPQPLVPAAATADTPVTAAGNDVPPAWTERALVAEDGQIVVVGRGAPASDVAAALESARVDAMVRLLDEGMRRLAGSEVYDFLQQRRDVEERTDMARRRAAERYMARHGATAGLDRIDQFVRATANGHEAMARYRVSEAAFANVLSAYRTTSGFQGLTVAQPYPTYRADRDDVRGVVVVTVRPRSGASLAGIRAGDRVVRVNSRYVDTVATFEAVARAEWDATTRGDGVRLGVEDQVQREVVIRKPAP